jgi:hypothetical protein
MKKPDQPEIVRTKKDWLTSKFNGFDAFNRVNEINATEYDIRVLFNELEGKTSTEHDLILSAFVNKQKIS